MNSLNALAESIASQFNKETDTVFIEKLKFDIKALRSTFVTRDSERNIIDSRLVQTFVMDLEEVDMSLDCEIEVGCKVLRTTAKVPSPIKLKSNSSFLFVGDLDGEGHTFCKVEDWDLQKHARYTSKRPIYDYFNDYIYIKNGGQREFLLIKSIFENPEDLKTCCSTSTNVANFDLDTYPMTLDLAARIKDTLEQRLRGYNGEDKEVKIDKEGTKK